jgi:hypothetical protein
MARRIRLRAFPTMTALLGTALACWYGLPALAAQDSISIVTPLMGPGGPVKPAEGTAAISGVVSDALSHAPIAGAVVNLRVQVPSRDAPNYRQIADSKGRFVFTKLPARNDYVLNASDRSHLDGGYGRTRLADRDAHRIALGDGQWLPDVDIVLFRLGSISGTVVDERGEPAVRVYVRAIAQVTVAGRPRLAGGPVTTTDDRGFYRLGGLGPGQYLVMVPSVRSTIQTIPARPGPPGASADQFVDDEDGVHFVVRNYPTPPPPKDGERFGYPAAFFPAAPAPERTAAIDLGPGEDRDGATITLQPVAAARVRGRVEGPAAAFEDLILRLVPAELEDLANGVEAATAVVASDGTFAFGDVPSGRYVLTGQRNTGEFTIGGQSLGSPNLPMTPGVNGFARNSNSVDVGPPGLGLMVQSSGSSRYWVRSPVEINGRNVEGLVVAANRTAIVSGRLISEDGLQAAGPTFVALETAAGDPAVGRLLSGFPQNAAPGTFSIEAVPPGQYFIRPQGSVSATSVIWDGHDYADSSITVGAEDISGITIATTSKKAGLAGRVIGATGDIVNRLRVAVFPDDPARWQNAGLNPPRIRSATVLADGRFEFTTLPAGRYYATAFDAEEVNDWRSPEVLRLLAGSASTVTLVWGSTVQQDVRIARAR